MSNKQKWEAVGNLVRTEREPNGYGGWLVAECQHKEDAVLVAATHELYDALDGLLDELDSTPEIRLTSWGISTDDARAALAKARGEKP